MLKLTIGGTEHFDERTNEFVVVEGTDLELEHSLVSLSKWESLTNKVFLSKEQRTPEELMLYIICMIISPDYPDNITELITNSQINRVKAYIESPHTATKFSSELVSKSVGETITSELIYYWMTAFNIPTEYETWHLNRLFTLIRVCSIKNSKPKKMSPREIAQRNRKLNEERKAKYQTTG